MSILRDVKNSLVRKHGWICEQGTNNTMFSVAIEAPISDKSFRFDEELKRALNLPKRLNSLYDQKAGSGAYDRLWELTVISLCGDIEFFLKDLFSLVLGSEQFDRGFYQRFQDVICKLEGLGWDFEGIRGDLEFIIECFQVRHIAIHNMGFIDESFKKKVNSQQSIGERLQIDQSSYRRYYDAYMVFLRRVDSNLEKYEFEVS